MKTIYLFTLISISIMISANAQSFELTPDGFMATDKDYLTVDIEGSQDQLYKKSLIYFTGLYKNADRVISTVEPEIITLNGHAPNSVHRNSMHVFDMDYTLVIRFKDGKLRIDAPSFKLTTFTDKRQTLHLVHTKASFDGSHLGIYGKGNKLKSKKAKADLENYFNSLIAGYIESFNTQNDW